MASSSRMLVPLKSWQSAIWVSLKTFNGSRAQPNHRSLSLFHRTLRRHGGLLGQCLRLEDDFDEARSAARGFHRNCADRQDPQSAGRGPQSRPENVPRPRHGILHGLQAHHLARRSADRSGGLFRRGVQSRTHSDAAHVAVRPTDALEANGLLPTAALGCSFRYSLFHEGLLNLIGYVGSTRFVQKNGMSTD